MSIVIAVANMSRVVVKCDGLDRDIDTGEIKSQDYEKMINLNPNCIVGYTGINELCEEIIDEYRRLASESNIDINDLKPTTITYDLCELSKAMNANNKEISFLVTGNENNRIVLFGFTNKYEYEISNFTPVDDEHIKYITLGSDLQSKDIQYSKYYHAGAPIELTMNKYIRYISTIDIGVNDHIFTKKISIM
jgi:hypothetical protein